MRNNSLFLGALIIGILSASSAQAASLYIDPAYTVLGRGDSVTMSVRLDTDEEKEECINAVDGVITYSESLSPVDVSVGDSIFSMWVEQPKIDKEKHTITFAGGIPNGYCGRIQGDPRLTNTIVKLIFRSPGFIVGGNPNGSSTAKVEFAPETTAYLNDGQGTKAQLAMYGAKMELGDKPGPVLKDDWRQEILADNIPPEQFSIDLQKDEHTFGGKYYIVFNTTDKQTGIDQYQIMEEPVSRIKAFEWGRADAPWVVTKLSTYELKDQSLNSIIRVKATDKAGNEYVATLVPDEKMRGFATYDIIVVGAMAVIGLLLIAIAVVGFRSYRAKRRAKQSISN